MRIKNRRRRRRRRKVGRGVPTIADRKIYFGQGVKRRRRQLGSGGLSALVSKLICNLGDAIGI